MDIVNIEAVTFERLVEKVETLCSFIERIVEQHQTKALGEWIDNQEVCQMLGISSRKLQFLRDSGRIAYTRIDRRIFYKKNDVVCYLKHYLKQNSNIKSV